MRTRVKGGVSLFLFLNFISFALSFIKEDYDCVFSLLIAFDGGYNALDNDC